MLHVMATIRVLLAVPAAAKLSNPMAVSATPSRYPRSGERLRKWFKRNCTEVLGRECSAQEKGDWLTVQPVTTHQ